MKKIIAVMERINNDRWFLLSLALSAYFFLVLVLLQVGERSLVIAQSLFLLSVLLLVVRIIFLIATKNREPKEPSRVNLEAIAIIKYALIAIGYLALIAIILTNDYELIWMIYGLISLIVIVAIIGIIGLLVAFKKNKSIND